MRSPDYIYNQFDEILLELWPFAIFVPFNVVALLHIA